MKKIFFIILLTLIGISFAQASEKIVSIFMKMHQTVPRLRRNLLTNFFDVEVVARKCPSSPRCLRVPKGVPKPPPEVPKGAVKEKNKNENTKSTLNLYTLE